MVLDVTESQESVSMRLSKLLKSAHTRHQWPPEPTLYESTKHPTALGMVDSQWP